MKKIILILIIFFQLQLFSQNLVINPSFELTKHCADTISSFNLNVKSWSTPNNGTTDLFNKCNSSDFIGIPENYMGYQDSNFGSKYSGFYLYSPDNYREYIQGMFKSPLQKGVKYRVSFYISLSENSKYALGKIGFMLSNPRIMVPNWGVLSKEELKNLWLYNSSMHEISNKESFKDKNKWIWVSKEIIANGGENFLVIGNFDNNVNSKKRKINKNIKHNVSYYFIDLVSVEPIYNTKRQNDLAKTKKNINSEEEIILDKKYVFKNVKFKLNSVEIKGKTTKELEKVVKYLNENKNTNIVISGHTDNLGNDKYNQELSEKRAYSVRDFFVTKGISEKRIETIGYGNSKPLNSNETENERFLNRRVEFIITKHNNTYNK